MSSTTPEPTPLHPTNADAQSIEPKDTDLAADEPDAIDASPAVELETTDTSPAASEPGATDTSPAASEPGATEAGPAIEPDTSDASPDETYAGTTILNRADWPRATSSDEPEPQGQDSPNPAATPRELLTKSQFSRNQEQRDRDAALASLDETILRPPLDPLVFEEARRPKVEQPAQPSKKPNRAARILAGVAACLAVVGVATAVRWTQNPRVPQLAAEKETEKTPSDVVTTVTNEVAPIVTPDDKQTDSLDNELLTNDETTREDEYGSRDNAQDTSDSGESDSRSRRKRRDSSDDERDSTSTRDSERDGESSSDYWWLFSNPDSSETSESYGQGESSSSDGYSYDYGQTDESNSGNSNYYDDSYNPWTTEDGDNTSYDHFYVYLSPTGESSDESGYSYDLGNGYSIGYGYGQGSGDYYTIDIPTPRSDYGWRWW